MQWIDRLARRWHERKVLRRALIAELLWLLREFRGRVPQMEKAKKQGFRVPTFIATQMYDRLPERIGLLKADEGEKVIHAYLGAKHLAPNLRQLARQADPLTPAVNDDHIGVYSGHIDEVIRLHRERIDLFKQAIRVLGSTVRDNPDTDGSDAR